MHNTQFINALNGKIEFYINGHGDAVLVDYIGESEILYIPDNLGSFNGCEGLDLSVADYIPDESFKSCRKVKTIVFGTNMHLGLFLFANCENLTSIVSIDANVFSEEFTFTKEDFCPIELKTHELISTNYGNWYDDEHYADTYKCKRIVEKIVLECAKNSDHERLFQIVSLENIGARIICAIQKDDVDLLLKIDSLGITLDDCCPFIIEITDTMSKSTPKVFEFLLSRKLFRASWSKGSPLYHAVKCGSIELVKKLLDAGDDPFSTSPEWDGERLVYEVAKELGETDIYNILIKSQDDYDE